MVTEPDSAHVCSVIRFSVSAFLTTLWLNGALVGRNSGEAFSVWCEEDPARPTWGKAAWSSRWAWRRCGQSSS